MTETAKKGNGLGITGFILGILAVIFSFIPLMGWLTWILAILALVFGLIGCFGNKKSKGLAFVAILLAVTSICVIQFYTAPKVKKAAADIFKEVVKNVDEQKLNEAAESIGDAVEKAVEEAPAE